MLIGRTAGGAGLKQGLGRLRALGKFGNGAGRAVWMGFVPTWVRRRHRLWKLDAAAAAPGNLSEEKGRRGAVARSEVSVDFRVNSLYKPYSSHGCGWGNLPGIERT